MAVQWLKLLPSNTGGEGSIPDWGAGRPPPPQHAWQPRNQNKSNILTNNGSH